MQIVQFLLTAVICLLSACAPLQRGFDGAKLVSPSRPAVMLAAPGLPTLVEGQVAPFLYTDRGYQFPSTLLGVYGKDALSPMAITVISFVPNELWKWDSPEFSGPHGVKTAGAVFGGQAFTGSVRIVDGATDPFSPLIAQEEQYPSIIWLAQRFALRDDFDRAKIILEYREPLQEPLSELELLPYNEKIRAFTARATRVFQVRFFGSGESTAYKPMPPAYVKSVNRRYLGPFLGSMSEKDVWPERMM